MLDEKILEKYYQQIAEKLDEIVPVAWDRIVMYAEETGESSSVCFYFYTDNCTKVHHWGDIPEEYNVDWDIVDSGMDELQIINKNLWLEFIDAGETPWYTLTFDLDKDWRFKVKYGYEIDLDVSPLEREIRWAYDELGIIPREDFEKKLLDEYLEGKKSSGTPAEGEDWTTPVFLDEKTAELIEEHIEKYIGKTDIVFHELLSDTIHIDIYHVKPAENRNYHTLITSGMSALPMTPPEKFKECKYAELYICLPADWDLSDEGMRDGKNYWPIRCLKALARFPHEYRTWLWHGHSVPNGNPPTPFAENVGFCGIMLLPPIAMDPGFRELQINEEKTIHFIAVMPLYEEEMNYKIKHGWRKLADRFGKYHINEIVDVKRKNVCKRSFWPFR